MIKLTNKDHVYNSIPTKPNDQFQKNNIESTKILSLKKSENSPKMHEILKIRIKGGVNRSYRSCGRKTLQKLGQKWQKIFCVALQSRREREKVEKLGWISQNTIFKKLDSRSSIDRKIGSINRTRQRLTEFFKQDFNWSKIRLDQSKFLKSSFLEKIIRFLKAYLKALNIRYKNAWVWDEMLFQNTSFKPNFSKI